MKKLPGRLLPLVPLILASLVLLFLATGTRAYADNGPDQEQQTFTCTTQQPVPTIDGNKAILVIENCQSNTRLLTATTYDAQGNATSQEDFSKRLS